MGFNSEDFQAEMRKCGEKKRAEQPGPWNSRSKAWKSEMYCGEGGKAIVALVSGWLLGVERNEARKGRRAGLGTCRVDFIVNQRVIF